jgi:hypothetical protein
MIYDLFNEFNFLYVLILQHYNRGKKTTHFFINKRCWWAKNLVSQLARPPRSNVGITFLLHIIPVVQ